MTRRGKSSEFEINFDGLTDSVTNLAGALILLVVLLLGVTTNAVQTTPSPPPVAPGVGTGSLDGLLEQVVVMRAELRSAGAQLDEVERDVRGLREKIGQLKDGNNQKQE